MPRLAGRQQQRRARDAPPRLPSLPLTKAEDEPRRTRKNRSGRQGAKLKDWNSGSQKARCTITSSAPHPEPLNILLSVLLCGAPTLQQPHGWRPLPCRGRGVLGIPSGRGSRPRESHPEALAELYVSLSTHTAPIMEPCYVPLASEQTSLDNDARGP